ncbi:chloromuconate cycloisomerase [Amycolatopsis sp. K13G38]|uniref:Chloromuconate cycloisomerase n=1 Tax=Amycolatopsis acididurans TaxID=2724524 RepID=A0ABX1J472_9PSEU|nr:muconate cycloisomerase family protein [Amycolatopsis acididurans]NKQ54597.1 chloromuconate cycloisomerase [Amycolatopsis acididurans]
MSALTIAGMDTVIVDLPLRRPHRFKSMTATHQSYLLVRVRTVDGIDGIGESVVPGGPWWGGESVETMRAVIDGYLAPELLGGDATRIELLTHRLDRVAAGNSFAKAAVEIALFDACGRALGVPVHRLLGGLYRESIPVTWALGAEDADIVIAEAEEKLEAGLHTSFKLKMGATDPRGDAARIVAVAKALADRASVRVDLNAAWDEPTSTRWLPRLEDAGVDLIEQPVPGWNIEAMRRIAARLTIPVMADESLASVHDALALCRAEAADIFSLKIHKLGGLAATRKAAAVAEAAGVPCHGGSSIESSVGTAAAAHAYGAIGNVTFGCELFGPSLLAADVVIDPVRYEHGELVVPDGPGLGVELDLDQVGRYARGGTGW